MTTVTINRTTSTLAPTPLIIIPLDTLGEMSSADELGSRVCKPPVVVSEGQSFDVNLSGTELYSAVFYLLQSKTGVSINLLLHYGMHVIVEGVH